MKRWKELENGNVTIIWFPESVLLLFLSSWPSYVQLESVEMEIFLQALIENSNIYSFIKAEFSSRFGRVLVYVTTTIYNSSLRFFIVINITF